MLKVFLSLVLISAILVGIYYAGNTVITMWRNKNSLQVQTPAVLAPNLYKTSEITESNKTSKYTINIQYPEFTGLYNKNTQDTINQQIKTQVNAYITGFKKEVTSANNPNVPPQLQANLTITFTPAQMDNQIVSFAWNVSDMQAGDAHPNNYTNVFNYNVAANQMITLTNLFRPNADYLNTLSQLASPKLKSKLQKENYYFAQMFDPGVAPTAKNYQNFLLSQNNLIIIFDYYQVAPGVVGVIKISLPYKDLSSILNPEYSKLLL